MAGGGLSRAVARAAPATDATAKVIDLGSRLRVRGPARHVSWRKRSFDICVSSALLVALAPVLILTWIGVRATSRGPGLYWSDRVGYRGRHFAMPKFRTMRVGAPLSAREHLVGADTHITLIGRLLRRFSIDETPQLFCVLRGDMSLIGPRPLIANDPAQAARAQFPDVMMVRPGLSGLAQVRGRNQVSPRRKARLDAFYARQRSWKLDLAIAASTALVVLTGRGMM